MNDRSEVWREVEFNVVERALKQLSKLKVPESFSVFVCGTAHQDQDSIKELLRGTQCIDILKIERFSPYGRFSFYNLIPFLFPYSVCLHLRCLKELELLVEIIQSPANIDIIFSSSENFKNHIQQSGKDFDYDRLKDAPFDDKQHVIVGIDTDHPESDTGIMYYMSIGSAAPLEMKSVIVF